MRKVYGSMKSSNELKRLLESIDRKSYPAYKSAQGIYDFGDYQLCIDHVQGDPFASPSKLSIFITHQKAGYPKTLFDAPHKKRAFEDDLVLFSSIIVFCGQTSTHLRHDLHLFEIGRAHV